MAEKSKTLRDEEIDSTPRVGRRGAIGAIGAGLLGAAAVVTGLGATPEKAQAKASDSDSGPNSDPAGRGRTGHTDRDAGEGGDRAGRGVCAERGHSDSDEGDNADPAGRGRGPCR